MRRFLQFSLAACLVCLWSTTLLDAGVRGRGHGRGGGRKKVVSSHVSRPPKKLQSNHRAADRITRPTWDRNTRPNRDRLTGGHRAIDIQRLNEERKLNHRLNTAAHLREISTRNGNGRLLEAADRMEQKAQEHYQRRLDHIERHKERYDLSKTGGDEPTHSETDPVEPEGSPDSAKELSGRNRALERQLLNEERKLMHRLDTAARLRENAARNGNERLLETADRMEQSALDHYERRLDRIEQRQDQFSQPEAAELAENELGNAQEPGVPKQTATPRAMRRAFQYFRGLFGR